MSSDSLSQARVLVVGAGALGGPAAFGLAHAGVREIALVDPDTGDLTNLHRQVWLRTSDIGRLKIHSLAERLTQAFRGLRLKTYAERVTADNVARFFENGDVVVDGTDDWRTKLLLSDAAVRTHVPVVYGGVLRMSGQAMVVSSEGVCLRCLFEEPDELPTCAQAGVLGPVAGLVGTLQATLAVELIRNGTRSEEILIGEGTLIRIDGETLLQRQIKVMRAEDCAHA